MRINKFLLAIVTLLFSFVLLGNSVFAQEETLEATVEKILEEKQMKPMGSEDFQLYQKLELLATKGSLKDKKITIENGNIPVANNQKYKIDDKVIVTFSKDFEGNDYFYITDYIRRDSLVWSSLLLSFLKYLPVLIPFRLQLLAHLLLFPLLFTFPMGLTKKLL